VTPSATGKNVQAGGGVMANGTGQVMLDQGDVLLLASDGIGAFEGRDGQLFQDVQLLRTLECLAGCSGRDVIDGLTASAAGFGQVTGVPDDINLVSVCRRRPDARAGGSAFARPRG